MTKPRKELVHIDTTPFYHCYVRCVRRAYLCGDDHFTGENYDYRKQWIVSRIKFLSYVFSIDICAYAVMSNHYHVVLHVDKQRALSWSMEEVAERWLQLYKGNLLVDRWLENPETMGEAEMEKISECIEQWRERLYDIGWFMRGVNEKIARMANEEENCKGRFWEGRYKSQALLDEAALLSCMAYVDLNPVRAGIENDLFNSDFTSIQQRIYDYVKDKPIKTKDEKKLDQRIQQQRRLEEDVELHKQAKAPLMGFDGSAHTDVHTALPFTREDYFELVDTSGRALRGDKRGAISPKVTAIVSRVGIDPNKWLDHIQRFGLTYGYCAGSVDNILYFSAHFERKWAKGVGASIKVYGT